MRDIIGAALASILLLSACQQVASTGGPSAPAAAPEQAITAEYFMAPENWRQHDQRDPDLPPRGFVLPPPSGNIRFKGSDHSNGQLVSGHYDGNGFSTRRRFDFVDKVVKITVAIDGAGDYMAMQIGPETGPAPELTTRQSFNGSIVVPGDYAPMTIVQRVDADGRWSQDYIMRDATSVGRAEGRLDSATLAKLRSAPLMVVFGDNRAGRAQYIEVREVHGLGGPQEPESHYFQVIEAAAAGNDAEALANSGRLAEAEALLIKTEQSLGSVGLVIENPLRPIYVAVAEGLIPLPEAAMGRILLARAQHSAQADSTGVLEYDALIDFGMFAAKAGQPAVLDQLAARLSAHRKADPKDAALVRGMAAILRGDVTGGYATMQAAGGLSFEGRDRLSTYMAAARPFYADKARAAALMGDMMPTNPPPWRSGMPSQPFVDLNGNTVAAQVQTVVAPTPPPASVPAPTPAPARAPSPPAATGAAPPAPAASGGGAVEILD